MNNDLKISMKLISSDNINMKLEDSKPINANMNGGIVEIDPIFTNSPAYSITYNDINYWNNKSNFSGNYNDLTNKPTIPTQTSQLINNSGFITKDVMNLANYTLSSNLSTVATTGLYDDLLEKPTIPTDTSDLTNNAGFITSDTTSLENYTLSSDLATVATTGEYSDLLNTPSLANVATSGLYQDLLNKPTLATVASTGDYDDLLNKPTIPTDTSDLTNNAGFITNTVNDLTNYTLSSSLSSVATSGSYNDLSNKPTIPTAATLNVYSTTEQVVGTWINNKPIYRIVYKEERSASSYSLTPPSNVETYTKIGITQKDDSGSYIKDYYWSSSDYLRIFITSVGIQVRTSKTTNYTHWIVVEYTKTTD